MANPQRHLEAWRENNKADVVGKVKAGKTVSPFDSANLLLDGFMWFQERQFPSSLTGVSFSRIAGQALGLVDSESRGEIKRVLDAIRPGGVFMILGHGGMIPCGAIGAKKAQLEAADRGEALKETKPVLDLLERVSPDIRGLGSPGAELKNAIFQAEKVMNDPEFSLLIRKKNLTVAVGIVCDCKDTEFLPLNRPDWDMNKLLERHPMLSALRNQLKKGLAKAIAYGTDLKTHYAHTTFIYDPLDLRTVLDPGISNLNVGGFCCVDARVKPNTPDSPKYLFRVAPNQTFDITVDIDERGKAVLSVGDMGSDDYRRRHVQGTKTDGEHGEMGNGHMVTVATSLDLAMNIRDARLERNDGVLPADITVASFDGRQLRMLNHSIGVDWCVDYDPAVPGLCGVTA
jgi:hypothetical protein